ncbi:ABC transporter permease [Tardiphaga sp. P9-11]|jgi:NitT/TauT family transport system permease protein|uniref:ABC transporter permease n=1 Tax=Tardiphaga sp. P9-11 TaxID=2024614 RepID=UPI0011F3D479|nr:ABC transporter permease [Tardiphaga sp. P9-11]KAA0073919.1 ABC transporter permease [Tardiphaga sp. P9-11]
MSLVMSGAPARKKAVPRKSRKKRSTFDTTLGRAMLQLLGVAIFFALWEAGVHAGYISAFLMGSPSGIFATSYKLILSGELLSDSWYTLFEAILGFIIGTIFGSLFGLALWYSVFVAKLVEPFIVAINSVPKIALAPIVVLWFGTGLISKIALAVSLTALVALIAAYQAAKDADVDLQSLMISMGADKHQVFWKAVVPSTLPSIIATFRINIGFGLVGAVVGEFISSQRGLGHMIFLASSLYDLNSVWVGLFTLMILGFVLYYVIDIIERTLLPWKQATTSHQVQV